jgi:TPP-dependent pyruvate/acetoin dehydrogenase alpha subunit
MPTCPNCHVAAIAVAQSASAVRDLGVAGAVSTAAASALGIAYKRRLFDGRVAHSAAGDADANQTHLPASAPGRG